MTTAESKTLEEVKEKHEQVLAIVEERNALDVKFNFCRERTPEIAKKYRAEKRAIAERLLKAQIELDESR